MISQRPMQYLNGDQSFPYRILQDAWSKDHTATDMHAPIKHRDTTCRLRGDPILLTTLKPVSPIVQPRPGHLICSEPLNANQS
jgi:hypothetical protein